MKIEGYFWYKIFKNRLKHGTTNRIFLPRLAAKEQLEFSHFGWVENLKSLWIEKDEKSLVWFWLLGFLEDMLNKISFISCSVVGGAGWVGGLGSYNHFSSSSPLRG